MPGVAAFFTLACLSSLGLPGTAGFVAEFLVFVGAAQSQHWWWTIPGVLGAFVTAVYVLRATRAIFWGPGPTKRVRTTSRRAGTEWAAPHRARNLLVVFGFWPRVLLDFIDVASAHGSPRAHSRLGRRTRRPERRRERLCCRCFSLD